MWLGHIAHVLPYFDALYAVLVTDPDRRYSHASAVLPAPIPRVAPVRANCCNAERNFISRARQIRKLVRRLRG